MKTAYATIKGIEVMRAPVSYTHLDVYKRQLPESLAPSLREQLSRARAWWLKDQAEGRSGVALPDALERK